MPAAIPIAIAVGSSVAGVAAAKIGSHASEKAVDTQTKAATSAAEIQAQSQKEALAFSRQQAENDYKNQEAARRANYDQWAAAEGRKSAFGQMVGLPSRNIPAYVPSQDPAYLGPSSTIAGAVGTQGAPVPPGGGPTTVPGATTVPNGDYRSYFMNLTGGKPLNQQSLLALAPQLKAAGIAITPPNSQGAQTKIGLPDGSWVRVLNGDPNTPSAPVWVVQPGTGGGGAPYASGVRPMGQAAAYSPLSVSPGLQMPTISGMLR